MKPTLLITLLLIGSTKVSAAIYTTKPGTKFYTQPNGEMMKVEPGLIQTPPLERKDGWCFFKRQNGREAANPPAGWTLCSNLNKFVGN